MGLSELTRKRGLAVLLPEIVLAPAAAIGAVYCATKFAPDQLASFREFICNHIVEPHLKFFQSYENAINKAHERYDRARQEERIAHGEPAHEVMTRKRTDHERSEAISDVLAKGAVAFGADILATYAGQTWLNHKWKTEIPAFKTTAAECTVHLGLMATMPKFMPGFMENMHYGIAKKLRSTFNMGKESADEKAVPYTYVTFPGQLASLASLAFALQKGRGDIKPGRTL